MIWDSSDNSDYRVASYCEWKNLEKCGTLENKSGVYLFANSDLHIKYVGKAGPRRMADEARDAIRRNKAYDASLVKALYTNSNDKASSLEANLINKYDPPNNST